MSTSAYLSDWKNEQYANNISTLLTLQAVVGGKALQLEIWVGKRNVWLHRQPRRAALALLHGYTHSSWSNSSSFIAMSEKFREFAEVPQQFVREGNQVRLLLY